MHPGRGPSSHPGGQGLGNLEGISARGSRAGGKLTYSSGSPPLLTGLAISEYLQEPRAGMYLLLPFSSAQCSGQPLAGTSPATQRECG